MRCRSPQTHAGWVQRHTGLLGALIIPRSAVKDSSQLTSSLRVLLEQHGGYIHPYLELVEVAACGVRGVAAISPISSSEMERQALISLPTALYFDDRCGASRH